ncbi:UDP-N-acetylmuramoylalanyl-D-glutamate--2,6-diaminopimelate ligase [Megasphaera cerevisiae DSM 20462]|uniref:UDP-N-acetylmuramoyl-L-alanyl-D-glutamate--2,6-diaminopimelate ligase n=1 Tax=Megasphaera cerevisiae DSM 20462 TaxID=1122219 RepID=A0A0J6WTQ8_9FIRM|nr:UDP-N-acetylmuramoyl-L-alanyl-D-glutamate--2,6-diaminopimelate ligase [Megasphaera cerevisiae]KMO85924.1 UDP-N-acetylmuramoylalanyl-D-glutamate--2,6-diaminopimelate ligase [Megasphaera cerevisiae DSM 20462]SKA08446.1 UDP-N-acetylmuramoylalanyl-D-glutamate--2,6-diaminopimelate ligase [Megasphaera cerevisiae DSM 20462]
MKTISELCKQIKGIYNIDGSADIAITGISSDSRNVEKGYLFICISGVHVDGAEFAGQAVEKGAAAVLTTKHLNLPEGAVQIMVPDIHHALEDMVPYFYDYPGKKMRMIGVTGTNGKTTTTHIIAHILRAAGYHVGVIGTIHALIDDEELPIHNTTPDIIELQHFLSLMQQQGMTHVVMEVSSHALALNRVAGIEYDTAVFTNLTQDHLDFHKTMENYVAAKAKLFQSLSRDEQVKNNKTAIVNIDDPWSGSILKACQCKVLTYGVEKDADLKGSDLKVELKKSSFDVCGPFGSVHLNMHITGLFNVYNTLAAIGAAHAEGVNTETIDKAIQTFHSVPGRFELVEAGQDFAIVVDYSHTPDSLEKALLTARAMHPNRILAVFGCGGDRDRTKRPIMGRIAAEHADIPIVTSDNPRSEDPDAIVAEVEAGVKKGIRPGQHHEVIADRRSAIRRAVELAQAGDIIVIAGKGHETYQILKSGTIHFDDREEARNAVLALKER